LGVEIISGLPLARLAAFDAFAGPLDLLSRFARRISRALS
jgi:hypothetical protein